MRLTHPDLSLFPPLSGHAILPSPPLPSSRTDPPRSLVLSFSPCSARPLSTTSGPSTSGATHLAAPTPAGAGGEDTASIGGAQDEEPLPEGWCVCVRCATSISCRLCIVSRRPYTHTLLAQALYCRQGVPHSHPTYSHSHTRTYARLGSPPPREVREDQNGRIWYFDHNTRRVYEEVCGPAACGWPGACGRLPA